MTLPVPLFATVGWAWYLQGEARQDPETRRLERDSNALLDQSWYGSSHNRDNRCNLRRGGGPSSTAVRRRRPLAMGIVRLCARPAGADRIALLQTSPRNRTVRVAGGKTARRTAEAVDGLVRRVIRPRSFGATMPRSSCGPLRES